MVTIKHILFPVDFSEQVKAVAPAVRAMAERFGAEVTLLTVMQPYYEPVGNMMMLGEMGPPATILVNPEEVRKSLENRLAGALMNELKGVPVKRVVEIGDPAGVITQYARSEGVDLIMMPTHGYGPFRALLLGSVAAKVLHDAECPVWTAAHAARKEEEGGVVPSTGCKTVLCAVDVAPKSGPLMEWAANFAGAWGAKLRFVHAVGRSGSWIERQMDREFELTVGKEDREQLEKQIQSLGIRAPLCIAMGDVAEVVREQVLKHNADVVIIGRGMLDETFGRLRTNAYAIIRSASCPVLSV
jgi:nucleotide-binding universal stress UspA family protein